MKKVQIKGSERWLILFMGISFALFLLRHFLWGYLNTSYLEYAIFILVFILLIFLFFISFFIIYSINSEIKKEKNITREFGVKNIKEFFAFCVKYDSFRTLLYFNLFIIFINSFLSDLFRRCGSEAMRGLYIVIFLFVISFSVTLLIALGVSRVIGGNKNSFALKFLLSILLIITPTIISFFIYRILWASLFLLS